MKLEDFAFAISKKIFHELEHKHHFSVPEEIRKKVIEVVKQDLDELIN